MTYMAYLDITVGFSKVIDEVDNNRPNAQTENNPIDYEKRRNSIFHFFQKQWGHPLKDDPDYWRLGC